MTHRRIVGEVRLDNRAELFRSLDIRDEDPPVSDLALILLAYDRWGDDCPARLLGDFAFAIHDDGRGRAFGARDHMGVKPFYYRASERGLAFATRASSIADVDGLPLELDHRRVADVCVGALECGDLTSTFFLGVHRLPPGHKLKFEAGRATVARYWAPDPSRELRLRNEAEYVEGFREVFGEAVRCRLSGPAASMLSGGLDSSAIVGFARSIRQAEGGAALTTLSGVTDEPDCKESPFIRSVMALPGIDPMTVRPDDVGTFRDEIETFIATMEEPFDDTMILPLLMYVLARRRGISAVLDGVDGDVVASHEPDIVARFLRSGDVGTAIRQAGGFAEFYRGSYPGWSSTPRILLASTARVFTPGIVRRVSHPLRQRWGVRGEIEDSFIDRDFAVSSGVPDRLRTMWAYRPFHPDRSPRERQAEELLHPQYPAALERYHRVAASQGVEARHPFFDKRVVEFCLALPWDQKVRDGWPKRIVRTATEGLLPDEVCWRRGRWVHLGWKFVQRAIAGSDGFLAREMSGPMTELAPYADVAKLRKLYRSYRDGHVDAGSSIWTAAVLSSWLRKTAARRYDSPALTNGPAALSHPSLAG